MLHCAPLFLQVLFVQEAVKGLKKEFESPKGLGAPTCAYSHRPRRPADPCSSHAAS